MSLLRNAAMVLAGVLSLAAVPAPAAAELPAALQACRAEADAALRLACFDREADRMARDKAPAAAAASTAAPTTAEDQFGYRGEMARDELDRMKEKSRSSDELVAVVTGIAMRPRGEHVITLDNGQVWAQTNPDAMFRLALGDTVKIKPASLGSFLLSGPAKRSTRVNRIR